MAEECVLAVWRRGSLVFILLLFKFLCDFDWIQVAVNEALPSDDVEASLFWPTLLRRNWSGDVTELQCFQFVVNLRNIC